jgi:KDO2-lipid IV(A) lauroyltransferase
VRCWLLAPLAWLARALARLPQGALLALATALEWLLRPLLARRRRIAAINLALCFPELDGPARGQLLRANQRATVMGALELLRAWYAPASALAGLAEVDGLPRLQAALAAGQGVLLFTGHFTHTELAVRLLSESLGRPVRVVVRRHNSPCVEALFERARARVFGATLAKKDVRGLLRALQAGEPVVYSADQNFTYQHAFVPFFGIAAATLASTPDLVRRGQAQMLPFFFHRRPDGRYQLRIGTAWPQWSEAGGERAAAIYMRELEAEVRAHPEQYLWVHRRFKTRLPGQPPLY